MAQHLQRVARAAPRHSRLAPPRHAARATASPTWHGACASRHHETPETPPPFRAQPQAPTTRTAPYRISYTATAVASTRHLRPTLPAPCARARTGGAVCSARPSVALEGAGHLPPRLHGPALPASMRRRRCLHRHPCRHTPARVVWHTQRLPRESSAPRAPLLRRRAPPSAGCRTDRRGRSWRGPGRCPPSSRAGTPSCP